MPPSPSPRKTKHTAQKPTEDTKKQLGDALRARHKAVLDEQIPDHLLDLIEQLRELEKKTSDEA